MPPENEPNTPSDSNNGTPPSNDPPTSQTPTSSTDLLGDDTPQGNDTTPSAQQSQDLLDGPQFDGAEVTPDAFKGLFEGENEWNDEQLTDFLSIVNGAESRADMAKQLFDLYDKYNGEAAEALSTQFADTIKAWQGEVARHPTLGGENQAKTLASVKNFINTYAENAPEALAVLKQTGLGNNIHLIQLLHKAAEFAPKEATPAEGKPASNGVSTADRLFPTTAQTQT